MRVYTDVLDKGFIRLVDTMPTYEALSPDFSSLDQTIVDAARASYGKKGTSIKRDKKLLKYLIDHNHTSPLEMTEFKWQMKAPVVVWWQHVRHRVQELNMRSGRYVEYDDTEIYVPETFRTQSQHNKQASDTHFQNNELLEELVQHYDSSTQLYKKMLDSGVAKEQARLALPGFAMYHTGIFKMNLHAMLNYFRKRDHKDAQYEIREYSKAMKEIVSPFIPCAAKNLWGYGNQKR